MVETPTRRNRPKKSTTPDEKREKLVAAVEADEDSIQAPGSAPKAFTNGSVNGHVDGYSSGEVAVNGFGEGKTGRTAVTKLKNTIDESARNVEFGGSWGVSGMMIGFPLLMWYMWIGATYYDGHWPLPAQGERVSDFLIHLGHLVYEGAFPHLRAWTIYWTFFVFEAVCYLQLPGVYTKGRPLLHENGKQLTYYCSGIWSFYATTAAAAVLHSTGLFKLSTLLDEFGPLMSVAIISGFIVSIVAYVSALYRGSQHRMTGYPLYDFFMGAELNPRLFSILDFKMFLEVRIPWYILFLLSASAAARQYEQFGWVSGEVGFLVMAHFLYANACSKGEELIVPSW